MSIVFHDFDRTRPGTVAETSATVQAALVDLGFKITAPVAGSLHGERGSAFAMSKSSVPLLVDVTLREIPGNTTIVQVHLADRMTAAPFASASVKRNYQSLFGEVETAIDLAFGGSGFRPAQPQPVAGGTGPPQPTAPMAVPPKQTGVPGQTGASKQAGFDMAGLTEQASTMMTKMSGAAKATAAAATGHRDEPWQRVEEVVFVAGERRADVTAARLQAHMSIAAMIDRQPDALPENLTHQLQRVIREVMATMEAAGSADMPRVRHNLDARDVPVLEFVDLQARIREQLPVRTLQHCQDCGQEKVMNPDYKKLVERNRKIQALTGAVGLTIRSGAVSPFLLVGALFRLRTGDPDFVCPRCQGMDSDNRIVTFCPGCGALQKDAVLKSCGRCQHDFRTHPDPEDLWRPVSTMMHPDEDLKPG